LIALPYSQDGRFILGGPNRLIPIQVERLPAIKLGAVLTTSQPGNTLFQFDGKHVAGQNRFRGITGANEADDHGDKHKTRKHPLCNCRSPFSTTAHRARHCFLCPLLDLQSNFIILVLFAHGNLFDLFL
jgi:hypothetical protein